MKTKRRQSSRDGLADTERMPVLFIGHGNPMSAIAPDRYSQAWTEVGKSLPRPRAVLSISAHWFANGIFVHGGARPRTIHDFYGFPKELYAESYPCPGAPEAATELCRTVKSARIGLDTSWGVDHGTWIVTKRLFPRADIPVFQLSIDCSKPPQFHYDLGRELSPLRRRGVLVLASGNMVHNLGMLRYEPDAKPYDWALEFDDLLEGCLRKGEHRRLIDCESLGADAALAVPTLDHYWPMLYALGLQEDDERPEFFAEGIAHASISMRCFRLA
jgi:4,5-DOPA dioxygenase extradiol